MVKKIDLRDRKRRISTIYLLKDMISHKNLTCSILEKRIKLITTNVRLKSMSNSKAVGPYNIPIKV